MARPTADLDGCAAAHSRLRALVGDGAEVPVRQRSLVPGWTVGHVLTHLARNAEAMCRRVEAAAAGEVIDQYSGGVAGRTRAIEDGAARDADTIRADVVRWTDELDAVFAGLADEVWNRPVRTVAGGEHPVAHLPFRRWREVEVHLIDLDLGLTPQDWSDGLVERMLPRLLEGVRGRTDDRALAAWLLGRGRAPDLDAWA